MRFIQLHDVKRLSPKTAGFIVIPHSKLNPYRDNLVYLRVSLTDTMIFQVVYREMRNTSCVHFVVATKVLPTK